MQDLVMVLLSCFYMARCGTNLGDLSDSTLACHWHVICQHGNPQAVPIVKYVELHPVPLSIVKMLFISCLLIAIIGTSQANAKSGHTPGILRQSNFTLMTPLIFKPLASHFEQRENSLKFLNVRQQTCPSGYGECNSYAGKCCPLGEQILRFVLGTFF